MREDFFFSIRSYISDESNQFTFLTFIDVSIEKHYSHKQADGNGRHFFFCSNNTQLFEFLMTYMPELRNDLSSKIIFNISADNSKFCGQQRIVNHLTGKISQIISYSLYFFWEIHPKMCFTKTYPMTIKFSCYSFT